MASGGSLAAAFRPEDQPILLVQEFAAPSRGFESLQFVGSPPGA